MKEQKKREKNLPENTSPVCYQNDSDIQEEYLWSIPSVKKRKNQIKNNNNKDQ
jgi:hypothetical protein